MSDRSKALDELRRVGSARPELNEMIHTLDAFRFEKQENPNSHRAMVLVATSYIDQLLEDALRTRLRPNLNEKASKRLFRGGPEQNAVFSTFNDKCLAAYAFDIISSETLNDLDGLRAIRNTCAHSLGSFDLNNDATSVLCNFEFNRKWYRDGRSSPIPDTNQKKLAAFSWYFLNYLAMQRTYAPAFDSSGYRFWRTYW